VGAGAFLTLPGLRVFLIDDLRNGGDENKAHGVNEVRFRQGRIVREGLHTTLSELRLRKDSQVPGTAGYRFAGDHPCLLSDASEPSSVTSGATLTGYHIPARTLAAWRIRRRASR
jgi:hypothetical protein